MSEIDRNQKLFTISPVRSPEDLKEVISLFTGYAASLNIDLSFQDFAEEMASMPGKYAHENGGELLIARLVKPGPTVPSSSGSVSRTSSMPEPGEAIGCVALRGFSLAPSSSDASSSPDTSQPQIRLCEMKRLYVSPSGRRMGLGRALAKTIIEIAATEFGYHEMRLDTLPTMNAAQQMYRDFGFVDIEPYRFNPVEDTRYLSLDLTEYRTRHLRGT